MTSSLYFYCAARIQFFPRTDCRIRQRKTKVKLTRTNITRILALLFVIGITVLAFSLRSKVENLEVYGYPGIFLASLLANATILMPAPGAAIVFAMGAIFNPLIVALVAAIGGALGETVGYLAGYSGQGVIERIEIYERIAPYVKKYGLVAIFIAAAIPNPFFDVAGVAAGVLKIPIGRFFIAVLFGQLIKMFLVAGAGSLTLNWLFPK